MPPHGSPQGSSGGVGAEATALELSPGSIGEAGERRLGASRATRRGRGVRGWAQMHILIREGRRAMGGADGKNPGCSGVPRGPCGDISLCLFFF